MKECSDLLIEILAYIDTKMNHTIVTSNDNLIRLIPESIESFPVDKSAQTASEVIFTSCNVPILPNR